MRTVLIVTSYGLRWPGLLLTLPVVWLTSWHLMMTVMILPELPVCVSNLLQIFTSSCVHSRVREREIVAYWDFIGDRTMENIILLISADNCPDCAECSLINEWGHCAHYNIITLLTPGNTPPVSPSALCCSHPCEQPWHRDCCNGCDPEHLGTMTNIQQKEFPMAHVSFVWCISRRYTALWEKQCWVKSH